MSAAAALIAALAPSFTEDAVANGDTRTLYLFHSHTKEQIAATYLVNGRYDSAVLEQLNWFLRDWRRDEPTKMDPRLFDVVWEAYRQAGATEPVHVVSAYRSPETNSMLRRRSRAVAKHSQHMLGKAMDTTMPGMSMEQIREIGMRMQRGGVGYYPTAGTPFVHLDVGGVRSWPRMSYDQLARLFPDGKTVHLPANNQPLARYEEAKAEIEARGNGAYVPAVQRQSRGLFAMLFGGGEEDEDSGVATAPPPTARKQWASLAPRRSAGASEEEESLEAAAPSRREPERIVAAERNLPRGETQLSAGPADPPAVSRTAERQKPVTTASLAISAEEARIEAKLDAALAAPLPPRRPMFLALAGAPLPPSRPSEFAALASVAAAPPARRAVGAIASLVDLGPASLRGGVIEEARSAPPSPAAHPAPSSAPTSSTFKSSAPLEPSPSKPEPLLAYAPSAARSLPYGSEFAGSELRLPAARPAPIAKPAAAKVELVPARLDRSNFRALTTAVSASRLPGGTALGATFAAPRSAARADAGLFAPSASSGQAQAFAGQTAILPTDRFVSTR
ncbi:DUF882 domain-containing protein [Methylosinus sp. RM1]|uniref:DUF882 domain-containing protein n=1 Tax=Methylosinus sp. RM1 TaxID=2583817 RepID=UPI00140AFFF3|nr:DUF882 domain-containing protein [Methylosinus sp. RM1]